MPGFTQLGGKSKTVFLHSEEDKTSQEFITSAIVKNGQPLKLDNAGTVSPWAATDLIHKLVGYAISDAASGEMVTAWTRGYAIIYAISSAATNAGPVAYQAYDSSTDIGGTTGYSTYTNSATAAQNNGWALDQSAGANELIRILLMD